MGRLNKLQQCDGIMNNIKKIMSKTIGNSNDILNLKSQIPNYFYKNIQFKK